MNSAEGSIEVHWPGWNCRGICMFNSAAENFVIKFPTAATADEKVLTVGSWALLNFMFWERRANQKS